MTLASIIRAGVWLRIKSPLCTVFLATRPMPFPGRALAMYGALVPGLASLGAVGFVHAGSVSRFAMFSGDVKIAMPLPPAKELEL